MIFYIISTILIIPAVIYGNRFAESYDGYEVVMGAILLIFGAIFFVINVIATPFSHTVGETSRINNYEELSYQYSLCNESQNINCAAIIKDVVEFNSDLRDYKHYNNIFDLYYSDEVANLPLVK